MMMSNAAKKKNEETEETTVTVLQGTVLGRTPQVPENGSPEAEIRLRPTDEQVNLADGLVREISGPSTWAEDFSKRAPAAEALSSALGRAMALRKERARAEAWFKWLDQEQAIAWQQVLELTGKLQTHFDVADAADPNIALRYPKMKAFFGVRADIAARGVATRKKNRAAKKPA
jgi:hypothetical protein